MSGGMLASSPSQPTVRSAQTCWPGVPPANQAANTSEAKRPRLSDVQVSRTISTPACMLSGVLNDRTSPMAAMASSPSAPPLRNSGRDSIAGMNQDGSGRMRWGDSRISSKVRTSATASLTCG